MQLDSLPHKGEHGGDLASANDERVRVMHDPGFRQSRSK